MDMLAFSFIAFSLILFAGFFFYLIVDKKGSADANQDYKTIAAGESAFQQNVRKRVDQDKRHDELRRRLIQAGFYGKHAIFWMSASKVLSVVVPLAVALPVSYFTSLPIKVTAMIAGVVAIAGIIGPSFALDKFKKARQKRLRRAIPDSLDILSICLEAGMSLPSSLARVSQELATAHPELALELAIVDRETKMGRGVGESMRSLAERFDLEELRSMSTVIVQAEKYGSSLSDAMEVFALSMRVKRMYAAETLAQKAVAKILIPTVICILPALFVVTLGPAVIMTLRALANP
jgi:tight adherence protein C